MNKEKSNSKYILVLSASLFSMFFGAGNLIFPSYVGFTAGKSWLPAVLGFLMTGAGLPLLSVVASAKSDGDINNLGQKVSKFFSRFLGIAIVLSIGPLMAIPRTGATTFEMAVKPLMPGFSPVIFALIYFGLSLMLAINPRDIVDKIGKILTPALFILLILIIVLGIVNPLGEIVETDIDYPFSYGFEIGYQTMDALAALLFSGVIIYSIKNKGYDDTKTQISMTLKSGFISIGALSLIYGGLGYLGATATEAVGRDISKVELIRLLAENSLKSFGSLGFSLVVALACLTTTIGLITTVGHYFNKLSGGRLSYRFLVSLTALVGAILSVVGVDNIVRFSGPVLSFLYPMVIVLIVLTIGLSDSKYINVFRSSIFVTMLVSLVQLLIDFGLLAPEFLAWLPLSQLGLAWLLPAMAAGLVGFFLRPRPASK